MKKRALISVYEKSGAAELAAELAGMGWEILSTGGTSKYLQEKGIAVIDVSAVTGFPECLDGRVKTLHPAIHAGLLARRDLESHIETLKVQGFSPIDLVCVNLYPFFEKVQAGLSLEDTVEFIDIGGPAMLRSAAKNFRDVIVLTDPADYGEVLAALKAGEVPALLRKHLAGKVFALTSAYDAAIARYLLGLGTGDWGTGNREQGLSHQSSVPSPQSPVPSPQFPPFWPLSLKKGQGLRYGENSHQRACLYLNAGSSGALAFMEQLHGKELSYNNIRDLDLAWKAACAFGLEADGTPSLGEADLEALSFAKYRPGIGKPAACVAVKHNTPCGIALGADLGEAFEKVYTCDPVSIFGGVVASTVPVDAGTAEKLAELFLEIVVAPDFENAALEILKKKKNLRLLRARKAPREGFECIAVDGGLLVQGADRRLLEKWEVPTKVQPSEEDIPDLIFGMGAVTWVKSNAILIVKDRAATGIGAGQVNRIWAAEQALERSAAVIKAAAEKGGDGKPARVLASDAFFPFPDVVEAAAAAGIKTVIQPGGSINDKLSVEACDRLGIAMVLTGTRHFKH